MATPASGLDTLPTVLVLWLSSLVGAYVLLSNRRAVANRLFFALTLAIGARAVVLILDSFSGEAAVWEPLGFVPDYAMAAIFVHFAAIFPPLRRAPEGPRPSLSQMLAERLAWDGLPRRKYLARMALVYGAFGALGVVQAASPSAFGFATALAPGGAERLVITTITGATVAAVAVMAPFGVYAFGLLALKAAALGRADRHEAVSVYLVAAAAVVFVASVAWAAFTPVKVGSLGLLPSGAIIGYAVLKHRFLSVAPRAEESRPGAPRFDLKRGLCYLAREEKPALSFEVLADAATHGAKGLVLTRTPLPKIRDEYGLKKTPVVWVGDRAPYPDVQATNNVDEVAFIVAKFLKEAGAEGFVLFDCFEFVAQTVEFRGALKLLYHLKEIVATHDARMVLSVNPAGLGEREVAMLGKEMEGLDAGGKKTPR